MVCLVADLLESKNFMVPVFLVGWWRLCWWREPGRFFQKLYWSKREATVTSTTQGPMLEQGYPFLSWNSESLQNLCVDLHLMLVLAGKGIKPHPHGNGLEEVTMVLQWDHLQKINRKLVLPLPKSTFLWMLCSATALRSSRSSTFNTRLSRALLMCSARAVLLAL